jgi:hypothetical protein
MPPIARAFVKAAFAYLLVAFLLGALMMLDRWLNISRWLKVVYASQIHLLMVGWITQLTIGVAYWMFPRFLKEQDPRPRGSDRLAWGIFACLNVGLLLRFTVEPVSFLAPSPWLNALLALSATVQAAAAIGFGLLIWGRVRAMEP